MMMKQQLVEVFRIETIFVKVVSDVDGVADVDDVGCDTSVFFNLVNGPSGSTSVDHQTSFHLELL